jgi:hypothetical protein
MYIDARRPQPASEGLGGRGNAIPWCDQSCGPGTAKNTGYQEASPPIGVIVAQPLLHGRDRYGLMAKS